MTLTDTVVEEKCSNSQNLLKSFSKVYWQASEWCIFLVWGGIMSVYEWRNKTVHLLYSLIALLKFRWQLFTSHPLSAPEWSYYAGLATEQGLLRMCGNVKIEAVRLSIKTFLHWMLHWLPSFFFFLAQQVTWKAWKPNPLLIKTLHPRCLYYSFLFQFTSKLSQSFVTRSTDFIAVR